MGGFGIQPQIFTLSAKSKNILVLYYCCDPNS